MSVKSECVFLAKGSAGRGAGGDTKSRVEEGSAGWVLDVQEKGPKGFTVQTVSCYRLCLAFTWFRWEAVLIGLDDADIELHDGFCGYTERVGDGIEEIP
jgi:hypothetical protein